MDKIVRESNYFAFIFNKALENASDKSIEELLHIFSDSNVDSRAIALGLNKALHAIKNSRSKVN